MNEQSQTVEVKRIYLQMVSPNELRSGTLTDECLRIDRAFDCPPSFYRYLYREVGRTYYWLNRLNWSDEQIRTHLAQPSLLLYVMYYTGSPAGYFELKQHADSSTEIAYFGLLPDFIGCGLGKHLLARAVERAWATGCDRVWLHTCTLDHPAALSNYLKRGFKLFKEETYRSPVED
jgi:GNAT superfamily N-acetyltransferase